MRLYAHALVSAGVQSRVETADPHEQPDGLQSDAKHALQDVLACLPYCYLLREPLLPMARLLLDSTLSDESAAQASRLGMYLAVP